MNKLRKIILIQIVFFASFFIYNAAFFKLFNTKQTRTPGESAKKNLFDLEKYDNATFPFKNGKELRTLLKLKLPKYSTIKLSFKKCSQNLNSSLNMKGRLVIMLVDAMRYDFIFEHNRMPFVTRLLRENKAVPFILKAKPPTVTLPRLKV
jgi:hypothetical protein